MAPEQNPSGTGMEDTLPPEPKPASAVATAVVAGLGPAPIPPSAPLTGAATTSGRVAVLPRSGAPTPEAGHRYEPGRALGEGGMGEVALAFDRDIERQVAIKRIRGAASPELLLRFAEEVRSVGRLEHPGIAPIYDVGVDEAGQHYVVMKFVEGETLERVIQRLRERDPEAQRRFTFAYRAQLFASVLEAVHFAHQRGLIHRDLKPANIMVGPYGEVTVLDWGIAKRVGAQEEAPGAARPQAGARLVDTQAGALLGTPLYMSPEQARGEVERLDARSDVFSLGLLFWELMSLEHPFAGRPSMEALLEAVRTHVISGPEIHMSRIRNRAPCEYAWFVLRALAHEPAGRFAHAGEMLEELRRVQRGEFAVQCDVTLVKRTLHEADFWLDRHGWLFRLLWGAGALGLGWGVYRLLAG